MTKPKVLVTAAAGHTGSAAVYQLLEMDFPCAPLCGAGTPEQRR